MPHIDHCTDINADGEVSRVEVPPPLLLPCHILMPHIDHILITY